MAQATRKFLYGYLRSTYTAAHTSRSIQVSHYYADEEGEEEERKI